MYICKEYVLKRNLASSSLSEQILSTTVSSERTAVDRLTVGLSDRSSTPFGRFVTGAVRRRPA